MHSRMGPGPRSQERVCTGVLNWTCDSGYLVLKGTWVYGTEAWGTCGEGCPEETCGDGTIGHIGVATSGGASISTKVDIGDGVVVMSASTIKCVQCYVK